VSHTGGGNGGHVGQAGWGRVAAVRRPCVIVIGGDIAHADDHLLAGVREVVYRRSTALATRNIRIARSTLDDRAGIIGAAVMVIEAVLARTRWIRPSRP
jgi:predicted NBD/HSP70 family sugar kinase